MFLMNNMSLLYFFLLNCILGLDVLVRSFIEAVASVKVNNWIIANYVTENIILSKNQLRHDHAKSFEGFWLPRNKKKIFEVLTAKIAKSKN